MTVILDGLTFALFMASAAFLLEVSPWLGQSRRRRVLTVVLLAAVAINVAFSQHPWQAATLLGLSVVFAATETARLRLQLLAATAIGVRSCCSPISPVASASNSSPRSAAPSC
jgi:hypothetical protein